MAVSDLLRRTWQRMLLRGVHYASRHGRFDLLYRITDPWQLDCAQEHYRFDATNAIIRRAFGTQASIIEIGCGEGLQSAWLVQICETLRGVDISPIAVARARQRCRDADFQSGDIEAGFKPDISLPADLVVACEVLYYIKDSAGFLRTISGLGRACLISYYAAHRARLDPLVGSIPGMAREFIRYHDTEWVVAWWRNDGAASRQHESDPSHDRIL